MPQSFAGSGPGSRTPDGCSVDFYRQLPYLGELEDIAPLLAPSSNVLELGCGTGRLCSRLLELGHRVAGVDESADMLSHLPPGVQAIRARIEVLRLERRWAVVLLPSHLINHPDAATREAFLRCARWHLAEGGSFFAKRHSTAWLQSVRTGFIGSAAGVEQHVDHVSRVDGTVSLTIRYEAFGSTWCQSFSTVALGEEQIAGLLHDAGFRAVRWHGPQRLWVEARAS